VLLIAPHPDDEVLGAGGTIARLSEASTPCSLTSYPAITMVSPSMTLAGPVR
jgi:hypothetical protein